MFSVLDCSSLSEHYLDIEKVTKRQYENYVSGMVLEQQQLKSSVTHLYKETNVSQKRCREI